MTSEYFLSSRWQNLGRHPIVWKMTGRSKTGRSPFLICSCEEPYLLRMRKIFNCFLVSGHEIYFIYHQLFLLVRDWSRLVTWMNTRAIFPNFQNILRVSLMCPSCVLHVSLMWPIPTESLVKLIFFIVVYYYLQCSKKIERLLWTLSSPCRRRAPLNSCRFE